MPCDTIQTTTVRKQLENADVTLLAKALESMGFTVKLNEAAGSLRFYGIHTETMQSHSGSYAADVFTSTQQSYVSPLDINKVKQAYAYEVVEYSVMPGWTMVETTTQQQGLTQ